MKKIFVVLRAGCNSPPAVISEYYEKARERLFKQGQQTWLKSRADGNSPDGREQLHVLIEVRLHCAPACHENHLSSLPLMILYIKEHYDEPATTFRFWKSFTASGTGA